jgi:hypothetical protein
VVGRASAVLAANRRLVGAVALLAVLLAYYAFFRHGPNLPTDADVAFVAFLLIPAIFALVWLALPLRHWRGLFAAAVALAVLAISADRAGFDVIANFAKLGAATAVAFWFLRYFESVLWIALVALLIPVVDSYSVWRGPTAHIISERPEVFSALSFSFPLSGERQVFVEWREPLSGPTTYGVWREPGGKRNDEPLRDRDGDRDVGFAEAELEADRDYVYRIVTASGADVLVRADADDVNEGTQRSSGVSTVTRDTPLVVGVDSVDSTAKLGLPDLLFFALFLAAADRFGLRRGATWLAMALSFGVTLAGTYWFGTEGLPALPLLAFGFLLPNIDLLWAAFRTRAKGDEPAGADPPPR